MAMRTKLPAGAIPRKCTVCPQTFRPMTEAEWRNAWENHIRGAKHEARANAVASPASNVPLQP